MWGIYDSENDRSWTSTNRMSVRHDAAHRSPLSRTVRTTTASGNLRSCSAYRSAIGWSHVAVNPPRTTRSSTSSTLADPSAKRAHVSACAGGGKCWYYVLLYSRRSSAACSGLVPVRPRPAPMTCMPSQSPGVAVIAAIADREQVGRRARRTHGAELANTIYTAKYDITALLIPVLYGVS